MRTLLVLALALPVLALGEDPAPAATSAPAAAPAPGVVETQPLVLSGTDAAAPSAAAPTAATAPAVPEAPAATPAAPAAPAAAPVVAGTGRFGVLVDAGFPAGGGVSLLFRPYPSLRLAAGPAWNYLSWGAQGSVTFVPWSFALSPTIGLEAGRYFDADLTWLAKDGGGVPVELKPLLRSVGYSYAGAMLGLEIGSQRGFAFVLRLGLSYFWVQAKGSAQTTTSGGTSGATDAQVTLTNPRLRATVPSLQLGFQYYF